MAAFIEAQARQRINYVANSGWDPSAHRPIATTNPDKLRELQALGLNVVPVALDLVEIQGTPREVLEAKARDAFLKNGGIPTIVEDTSFDFDAFPGFPGSYVKQYLSQTEQRQAWADRIPADNRGATFRVGLAICVDGTNVVIYEGETRGEIATTLSPNHKFAFDDFFIPRAEIERVQGTSEAPRTYADMTLPEKNETSARARAYRSLIADEQMIAGNIFEIDEPSDAQLHLVRKERLAQSPQALRYAFGLESLAHVEPNADLHVSQFAPLHLIEYTSDRGVIGYTPDPTSASQGLVLAPDIDLATGRDSMGRVIPVRLDVDPAGNPILLQMGPKATEMALASRAAEFMTMHSDDMYAQIRGLLDGSIPHIQRSNTRSTVLEDLLGMDMTTEHGFTEVVRAKKAVATSEIAYERMSFDGKLSRKQAAKGTLLLGPDGVVSSLYALGGMPPVTGSRDVLVSAALSYMRSWIPHNGVFVGNFDRQLQLFTQARDQIRSLGLPEDIERNCIAQIGISVGSENPAEIAQQMRAFRKAGGHAVRIYTTNPDIRVLETAKAIREAVNADGDDGKFLIAVGPVTDITQARRLHDEAGVGMFLFGHGGGENCTSLTAGGAANAIKLLYQAYLDPRFNDSLIGLEGGTGTSIGAFLPMLDVISLNRRGVGGIESTGGYYLQRTIDGKIRAVLPYPGTASAATQAIEGRLSPATAERRYNDAGRLRAIEGKPNYLVKPVALFSCTNAFADNRAYAGLALADQQAMSIYELRQLTAQRGDHNHVSVTPEAVHIAGAHRGQ